MRKLMTIAAVLAAPMMLAACGEKAEEAAPVEEVTTEEMAPEPATDAAATDAAAADMAAEAPAADAEAKAGEMTDTAAPEPKAGPPER